MVRGPSPIQSTVRPEARASSQVSQASAAGGWSGMKQSGAPDRIGASFSRRRDSRFWSPSRFIHTSCACAKELS
jgi:hypothetical protein